MPKLWSFRQKDHQSDDGVCMAMSYYLILRFLAGMELVPEVLGSKMGLFMISQMRGELANMDKFEYLKRLAQGDNLRAQVQEYCLGKKLALEKACQVIEASGASRAGVYISVRRYSGAGHAVAVLIDGDKELMFDPNHGLYDVSDDINVPELNYLGTGFDYASVVITGTPGDLKSVTSS